MNSSEGGADRETVRLWRVYKTVHQMIHDRGYTVSQAQITMPLSDFLATFTAGGSILEYSKFTIYPLLGGLL